MTTQILEVFTKTSAKSPYRRKMDCFVMDEQGLSFYRKTCLIDIDGTTKELQQEFLEPPGAGSVECAEAIALKLKKNSSKEEFCQLIAKVFLDKLPGQWVIKGADMKVPFSLTLNHLRMIEEANSLGFSLYSLYKGRQSQRTFRFSRSSPYLEFAVSMLRTGDKVHLLACEPSELRDPSHRLGIDPYPVDLGNGYEVTRQGEHLRAHQIQNGSLVWASKLYKTYRGARDRAIKRMQEENPVQQVREQLQPELVIEWLRKTPDSVVGHVECFAYEPTNWLQHYIFESTGIDTLMSNVHIYINDSEETVVCGWDSIPLSDVSPWLAAALEWIVGGDDRLPIPVTGQQVLDWISNLEESAA